MPGSSGLPFPRPGRRPTVVPAPHRPQVLTVPERLLHVHECGCAGGFPGHGDPNLRGLEAQGKAELYLIRLPPSHLSPGGLSHTAILFSAGHPTVSQPWQQCRRAGPFVAVGAVLYTLPGSWKHPASTHYNPQHFFPRRFPTRTPSDSHLQTWPLVPWWRTTAPRQCPLALGPLRMLFPIPEGPPAPTPSLLNSC